MEKHFRNECEMNDYINKMVSSINRELTKEGFCDFRIDYIDNSRFAVIELSKLDYKLKDYNINSYDVIAERIFNMDGYGYEVVRFLENIYKRLNSTEISNVNNLEENLKKLLK